MLMALAWIVTHGESAAQDLDSLISPGALSRAHAGLAGLSNCTSCHSPGEGVTDERCLACHTDLDARVRARRGFHRDKTRCVSCHVDHQGQDFAMIRWDRETFDHQETGYPLEGLHLRVASCEACHRPPNAPARAHSESFLLNDARCAGCHEDVHRGNLGASCENCHSVDTPFRDVRFDHDRARFRLEGAHRRVQCEKCHPAQKWKGFAFTSCGDCHQDPHRPSLGNDCERCHSKASWRETKFNHGATRFPLLGKHQGVACSRCHTGSGFRGIAYGKCSDCHRNDPHRPSLGADCQRCHSETSWTETRFDHRATRFPLLGKHQGVACSRCHQGEGFRGIAYARCSDCHQKDPHFGQFVDDCGSCHRVESFESATFDHAPGGKSRFPLTGRHQTLACSQCHREEKESVFPKGMATAVRYRPLETACKGCHQDVHYGQLGKNCESCHGTESFHSEHLDFVHDRDTRFPLRGRHARVPCADCHRPEQAQFPDGPGLAVRYKPIDLCSACHQNVHAEATWKGARPPLATRCETCHGEENFLLPAFDHARTSFPLTGAHASLVCDRCHDYAVLPERRYLLFRSTGVRQCGDCHRSPHLKGAERCLDCHSTKTWSVSVWKGDFPSWREER
jgi:hypothetical protein